MRIAGTFWDFHEWSFVVQSQAHMHTFSLPLFSAGENGLKSGAFAL